MTPDHVVAGARWDPVAYSTPDGDRVEMWRTTPPKGFAERLAEDLDGLWRELAERAAAANGALIDVERVVVSGRPAFRRVERMPPDEPAGPGYAATLVVLLDDDLGLEVTVTCSEPNGQGHPAHGSAPFQPGAAAVDPAGASTGASAGAARPAALVRARELIGRFTATLRVRE